MKPMNQRAWFCYAQSSNVERATHAVKLICTNVTAKPKKIIPLLVQTLGFDGLQSSSKF